MNLASSAAESNLDHPERFFLNTPLPVATHPALKKFRAAKLIYGCLKMHCGSKDRCRLLWRTIAKETDTSRPTVARSLKLLEELGLIQILQVITDNEQRASKYVLLPLKETHGDTPPSHHDTPPSHGDTQNISSNRTNNNNVSYIPPEPEPVAMDEKKELEKPEKPKNTWRDTDQGRNRIARMEILGFDFNRATNFLLDRYVLKCGEESLQRVIERAEKTDVERPGAFICGQLKTFKVWDTNETQEPSLSYEEQAQREIERRLAAELAQEPPQDVRAPIDYSEPLQTHRTRQEPAGTAPWSLKDVQEIRRRKAVT